MDGCINALDLRKAIWVNFNTYYLADILTQGNNLVLIIADLNFKTSTTNKTKEAVHIYHLTSLTSIRDVEREV